LWIGDKHHHKWIELHYVWGWEIMENTIAGSSTALPKLPLWNVIKLSYSTYFANFIDVLRIVWLWILLVLPVAAATSWLQASWFSKAATALRSQQPGSLPLAPSVELQVAIHASDLILSLCGVGIAVAWHRKLILNEQPGVSGSNIVSRSFWRYILAGIIILAISILPAWAGFLALSWLFPAPGAPPGSEVLLLFLLLFALCIGAFVALLRSSLLLPARAVGNVDLTLKDVWRATHWNTWRLFWGIVACSIPPLLLAQVSFWAIIGLPKPETFPDPGFARQFASLGTLSEIYDLLMLPISIGFLSHAYRYFFEGARTA
jgi:hypothetical protein